MAATLMTYKEAEREFGSQYRLKTAVNNGELHKLSSGLYSTQPSASKFEIITKKYPYGIVTGKTAYYLHGLTDTIPEKIQLATKRNATRIGDRLISQVFIDERLFLPGRATLFYDGAEVAVYNLERLLVELLRHSKTLAFDYYKELVTNYRKIVEDLDFYKIEEYVALYNKSADLFDKFQREVL